MTRTDRIVLAVLVLAAAALLALRPLALGGERGAAVQVELGGCVACRFPLLPVGETREVAVALPHGRAVLSLEQGGVRILPLPHDLCPKGLCSHTGLIRRPGETLICAPNRLVVRIVGDGETVDAVAR